jgi:hypothetical protein
MRNTVTPSHDNTPSSIWRWVFVLLGLAFVILPAIQVYIFILPTLEMLAFMPLSFYLQEMLSTFLLMNAVLLSMVFFLIGGLLLVFGRRAGYVLTLAASGFSLLALLETVIGLLIAGNKANVDYLGMAVDEVWGMMGVWFVLLVVVEITSLVLLNFKVPREQLKVTKKVTWLTLGLGIFLFLDFNLCLLSQFVLGN